MNGERSRLKDKDVKEFVMNHPSLTDAEKARFSKHRSFTYEYSSSISKVRFEESDRS